MKNIDFTDFFNVFLSGATIPGIGYYFVNSVTQRDYTTIMGVTIFFAAFLMAMVLLVDIFYCLIDPRIKFDA